VCFFIFTVVCKDDEFKCDKKCKPSSLKCDFVHNCLDGTDEEGCGMLTSVYVLSLSAP